MFQTLFLTISFSHQRRKEVSFLSKLNLYKEMLLKRLIWTTTKTLVNGIRTNEQQNTQKEARPADAGSTVKRFAIKIIKTTHDEKMWENVVQKTSWWNYFWFSTVTQFIK